MVYEFIAQPEFAIAWNGVLGELENKWEVARDNRWVESPYRANSHKGMLGAGQGKLQLQRYVV
ncbi:hypothetical protein D3C76_1771950 [compost metagenome]